MSITDNWKRDEPKLAQLIASANAQGDLPFTRDEVRQKLDSDTILYARHNGLIEIKIVQMAATSNPDDPFVVTDKGRTWLAQYQARPDVEVVHVDHTEGLENLLGLADSTGVIPNSNKDLEGIFGESLVPVTQMAITNRLIFMNAELQRMQVTEQGRQWLIEYGKTPVSETADDLPVPQFIVDPSVPQGVVRLQGKDENHSSSIINLSTRNEGKVTSMRSTFTDTDFEDLPNLDESHLAAIPYEDIETSAKAVDSSEVLNAELRFNDIDPEGMREIAYTLTGLSSMCHNEAKARGFWDTEKPSILEACKVLELAYQGPYPVYKVKDWEEESIQGYEYALDKEWIIISSKTRSFHTTVIGEAIHTLMCEVDMEAATSRQDSELIALLHFEASEALEACRKGNPESVKIPGFSHLEEELSDLLIRIFDYAGGKKLRLGDALMAKLAHNTSREHKHNKQF